MKNFRDMNSKIVFRNISHAAEPTIFKDYGYKKEYDVIYIGSGGLSVYPLRMRFKKMFREHTHPSKWKTLIVGHPGGKLDKPQTKYTQPEFAKIINKAKIAVTCASKYKYFLGKYIEVPMCGTLLAADLPDEQHDFFRSYMCVLDTKWPDDLLKIQFYLDNDKEYQKKIDIGKKLMLDYTTDKYAERFLKIAKTYLEGK